MLLEHVIMCRLIMGKKTEALGEMAQMASLISSDSRLQGVHDAQLHTLLGLYSMSMNCMDSAETQVLFKNSAAHSSGSLCYEHELYGFGRDTGIVHKIHLHTLLGFYAMSMKCMDSAETQVLFMRFSCALFWVFTL